MSLKILSLNIESHFHLDKIIPFIKKHDFDILALQEINENSLDEFQKLGYTQFLYSPMVLKYYPFEREISEDIKSQGVALFAKDNIKITDFKSVYYYEPAPELRLHQSGISTQETQKRVLVSAILNNNDEEILLGTTHFTLTPNGMTTPYQQESMQKFLEILPKNQKIILMGDFNIPRGYNPNYQTILEAGFFDMIPEQYQGSLDINLHRLPNEKFLSEGMDKYMVDYIFTNDQKLVSNVSLQNGISDHFGILAEIN